VGLTRAAGYHVGMSSNPYLSPAGHDDRLVRLTIKRLLEYKTASPTTIRQRQMRTLPLYALLGAVVIPLLELLDAPAAEIAVMVGVLIGAAVRDAAAAFKSVRLWKIQKELLDWQKIEAISRELEI
jgi:hypothetical protein